MRQVPLRPGKTHLYFSKALLCRPNPRARDRVPAAAGQAAGLARWLPSVLSVEGLNGHCLPRGPRRAAAAVPAFLPVSAKFCNSVCLKTGVCRAAPGDPFASLITDGWAAMLLLYSSSKPSAHSSAPKSQRHSSHRSLLCEWLRPQQLRSRGAPCAPPAPPPAATGPPCIAVPALAFTRDGNAPTSAASTPVTTAHSMTPAEPFLSLPLLFGDKGLFQ